MWTYAKVNSVFLDHRAHQFRHKCRLYSLHQALPEMCVYVIPLTSPSLTSNSQHVPKSQRPLFPVQRYPDAIESPQAEVPPTPPAVPPADKPTTEPVAESSTEIQDSWKRSRRAKSVPNVPVLLRPAHAHSPEQPHSPRAAHPQRTVMRLHVDRSKIVAKPVVTPPPPVSLVKVEHSESSQQVAVHHDFYRNSRRPQLAPVLHPEHRYCSQDEIVKPFRTHHCRACGTVRAVSFNFSQDC